MWDTPLYYPGYPACIEYPPMPVLPAPVPTGSPATITSERALSAGDHLVAPRRLAERSGSGPRAVMGAGDHGRLASGSALGFSSSLSLSLSLSALGGAKRGQAHAAQRLHRTGWGIGGGRGGDVVAARGVWPSDLYVQRPRPRCQGRWHHRRRAGDQRGHPHGDCARRGGDGAHPCRPLPPRLAHHGQRPIDLYQGRRRHRSGPRRRLRPQGPRRGHRRAATDCLRRAGDAARHARPDRLRHLDRARR